MCKSPVWIESLPHRAASGYQNIYLKMDLVIQGLQFGGIAVSGLLSGGLGVKAASFFLLSLALSSKKCEKKHKII